MPCGGGAAGACSLFGNNVLARATFTIQRRLGESPMVSSE
jgi:hypothetical protein